MQISSHFFLGRLALLVAVSGTTVSMAAPAKKVAQKVAPKKVAVKPKASVALQGLGNGIFILGEESSAPPQGTPSQGAVFKPNPASKIAVTQPQNQTGPRLVAFCRSYLGRKLGNGQCTELVMLGLPAVGGQLYPNYQWGNFICGYGFSKGRRTIAVGPMGRIASNPRRADVRPGDILQFENAAFEKHWDNGYSRNEYPHHTAVVEHVSRDGQTLKVLEQNVNGTQYVLRSTLYLPDMVQGTLQIMRPIAVK